MANKNIDPTYAKMFNVDSGKKQFPWLFISAVALLLAVIIMLVAFLNSYNGTVHLASANGGSEVVDKRNDIKYLLAPMCYEPVAYMDTSEYAKLGDTKFYAVRDADPKEYICTIDYGIYDLYYSDKLTLPSFEEFNACYVRICAVESISIQVGYIELKDTLELVQYYLSAESVDVPLSADIDTVQQLKFMSDDYKFMYYSVNFYKTDDGKRFIYDRSTGKCVDLGDKFDAILVG